MVFEVGLKGSKIPVDLLEAMNDLYCAMAGYTDADGETINIKITPDILTEALQDDVVRLAIFDFIETNRNVAGINALD